MKLLSIDTSTKNFSLAVSDAGRIIKSRNVMLRNVLSSSIIPSIQCILDQAGFSLKQLDGFAVGLGPGSFTSLRIGVSTIKSLAFALNKPIVGISSLDVLAMNVIKEKPSQVCTLCDAKRGLVYACVYEKKNEQLKKKIDYLLADVNDVLRHIKGDVVFVGDGIGLYKDVLKKASAKGTVVFADSKKWFPQAKSLAALAQERFLRKKFDRVDRLVPLYLYPEDCQVRR